MPRLLELYSGTGSVGKVFRQRGWEVVSLDNDPSMQPTICADLLTFDYRQLGGSFDAVFASPPCTHYSRARSKAKLPRNLDHADACVRRALEIIQYFEPRAWFLENPQTGLLKTREVVHGLPFVDVTYCVYGFNYQKATRLWTNCGSFPWLAPCRRDCHACVAGKHALWAQKGGGGRGDHTTTELYRMPPLLCQDIFEAAQASMSSEGTNRLSSPQ